MNSNAKRTSPERLGITRTLLFYSIAAGVSLGLSARAFADDKRTAAKPNPSKKSTTLSTIGKAEDADQVITINERLSEKWKANKLTPSARCSDYEFIRRASLDIIGRIAKPEEITRFVKDPEGTRRALLV